jgi:hypothetical protein
MHIVTRPREETITVDFNGKRYEVHMGSDGAYIPNDLGAYMVAKGLVGPGFNSDPKPRWAMDGTVHGDLMPMFAQWCKEIPASDIDDATTPEAVAKILERKVRQS